MIANNKFSWSRIVGDHKSILGGWTTINCSNSGSDKINIVIEPLFIWFITDSDPMNVKKCICRWLATGCWLLAAGSWLLQTLLLIYSICLNANAFCAHFYCGFMGKTKRLLFFIECIWVCRSTLPNDSHIIVCRSAPNSYQRKRINFTIFTVHIYAHLQRSIQLQCHWSQRKKKKNEENSNFPSFSFLCCNK